MVFFYKVLFFEFRYKLWATIVFTVVMAVEQHYLHNSPKDGLSTGQNMSAHM